MDNLTHSLVGALIGQAGLKKKTGLAMPALIIGANIPDIDASCVLIGDMQHLALRRGLTHGPIAWVVLPLILAGLLYGWDRWQERRGKRPPGRLPVRFGWLYALGFLACLTHPAMDWMNSYGIRLLEPFSHQWFYGDVLFIIDLWLWVGMGIATWLSLRREKRGGEWKRPARIALCVAATYIALNFAITANDKHEHGSDLRSGAEYISSPVPLAFWERKQIFGMDHGAWYSSRLTFPGGPVESAVEIPPANARCQWPDTKSLRKQRPDLDAFLFWSRAPYAQRSEQGDHVIIRDARFSGAARFEVELPEVPCVGISQV